MSTCRTCAYLGAKPRADGKIVPRKNYVYPCGAPIPEMPTFPHSITTRYDFRWPPLKTYVRPEMGEGCPTYTKRIKATGGQA